jgi:hypothetical protein
VPHFLWCFVSSSVVPCYLKIFCLYKNWHTLFSKQPNNVSKVKRHKNYPKDLQCRCISLSLNKCYNYKQMESFSVVTLSCFFIHYLVSDSVSTEKVMSFLMAR